MNSARWQEAGRLFDAALKIDAAGRREWLREQCAGDEALFKEVCSLLEADENSATVLEHPLVNATGGGEKYIGRMFGVYRISSHIASGGMGQVFLARRHDGLYEQQVVVKIIHARLKSSSFMLRFRRERQILAGLNHPHIAHVIDGGLSEDGTPYLVMTHAEGLPLDKYLEQQRPTLNERLHLFMQICEAVIYAHRHLVVHRDLKPDNIFVDSRGQIKLLDFGIAKVLEEKEDTFQTVVDEAPAPFTPQYAAPEQIEGGLITTSADVYALGVILYQMLSGTLPYRVNTTNRPLALQLVRDALPERPSRQVSPALPYGGGKLRGDLDTICLKTLKKEPARRYESVETLKNDIQRYHRGLPILARDDTLTYRIKKFTGRHAIAVGLSAAFTFILVLVVSLYTLRLTKESERARQEALKSRQVAAFLTDLFDAAGPQSTRGRALTPLELVQTGTEKIEKGLPDQPGVQAEMFTLIGDVYRRIGEYEQAARMHNKALERNLTLFGVKSEPTARGYLALAGLHYETGEMTRARSFYERALVLQEHVSYQQATFRADILMGLGNIRYEEGSYAGADSLYGKSLTLYRGEEGEASVSIATALNGLGDAARKLGRYGEAETYYKKALAMRQRLLGGDHADVAHTLNHLARLLYTTGDYSPAESYARQALALRASIYGYQHLETIASISNLANILQKTGQAAEAGRLYRRALKGLHARLGEAHPYIAAVTNNLGKTLLMRNKADSAAILFRQSMAMNDKVLPPEHINRATPMISLGRLLTAQGRTREALPLLRTAYDIRQNKLGPDNRQSALAANALAECLIAKGEFDHAGTLLNSSLAFFKKDKNPHDLKSTRALLARLPK